MIWLLYYVLASWCVAAVFAAWFWRRVGADGCDSSRTSLLSSTCLMVFTGPIWMPLLAVAVLRCGRQVFQVWSQFSEADKFRKTYHEYSFRPAEYYRLPQEIRDWWDASTPEFFQNGYSMLGDYQLRDEPYQMCDRFYWHDSGESFCSACREMTIAGVNQMNYSMASWLSNGAIVHTNTVQLSDEWEDPDLLVDKMDIASIPDGTVDELALLHVTRAAEIAERHGFSLLVFDADQHQELVIYDRARFAGGVIGRAK